MSNARLVITAVTVEGSRHGEIVALNNLGELSTRTSAPEKASEIHREALAKAIELGAPAEEARALARLVQDTLDEHGL